MGYGTISLQHMGFGAINVAHADLPAQAEQALRHPAAHIADPDDSDLIC